MNTKEEASVRGVEVSQLFSYRSGERAVIDDREKREIARIHATKKYNGQVIVPSFILL